MKHIDSWKEAKAEEEATGKSPHNDKLKPCPLCGRKVKIVMLCETFFHSDGGNSIYATYRVWCLDCRLSGMRKLSPYHAVLQWNGLAERILSATGKE